MRVKITGVVESCSDCPNRNALNDGFSSFECRETGGYIDLIGIDKDCPFLKNETGRLPRKMAELKKILAYAKTPLTAREINERLCNSRDIWGPTKVDRKFAGTCKALAQAVRTYVWIRRLPGKQPHEYVFEGGK